MSQRIVISSWSPYSGEFGNFKLAFLIVFSIKDLQSMALGFRPKPFITLSLLLSYFILFFCVFCSLMFFLFLSFLLCLSFSLSNSLSFTFFLHFISFLFFVCSLCISVFVLFILFSYFPPLSFLFSLLLIFRFYSMYFSFFLPVFPFFILRLLSWQATRVHDIAKTLQSASNKNITKPTSKVSVAPNCCMVQVNIYTTQHTDRLTIQRVY